MAKRKSTIHSALRDCRKNMGMSQQELGSLLGSSRNTIRCWEVSKEPKFLDLLCKGLGLYRVFPHIHVDLSGPCLVAARTRFGLHQDELASRLSVSRATLSRWENDTPPGWVLFALAALALTD
ncbi:helix-turn-helix transcriptional regulator [Pseudomonas tritici]|uniref:helix-turn-helix transcriptional regulator n=1 Tax=Pseudomonas tritici TaxID=2745518 RepID=UPI00387AD6DD